MLYFNNFKQKVSPQELAKFNEYRTGRTNNATDGRSPWKRADVVYLMFDGSMKNAVLGMANIHGVCYLKSGSAIGKVIFILKHCV